MIKILKTVARAAKILPAGGIVHEFLEDRRHKRECETRKDIAKLVAETTAAIGVMGIGVITLAVSKGRHVSVEGSAHKGDAGTSGRIEIN